MADLTVNKAEIGLLMMGLNSIEDAWLDEDGKITRAGLAFKLGSASADEMIAARTESSDG